MFKSRYGMEVFVFHCSGFYISLKFQIYILPYEDRQYLFGCVEKKNNKMSVTFGVKGVNVMLGKRGTGTQ